MAKDQKAYQGGDGGAMQAGPAVAMPSVHEPQVMTGAHTRPVVHPSAGTPAQAGRSWKDRLVNGAAGFRQGFGDSPQARNYFDDLDFIPRFTPSTLGLPSIGTDYPQIRRRRID